MAAVIVAFASVGSNWYLNHRAEQRENRRALETQAREYKQAKRLVDDELSWISSDFAAMLHLRTTPVNMPRKAPFFLPSTAWQRYKELLAAELPESLWQRLTEVYFYVRGVRFDILSLPQGDPLNSTRIQTFTNMLEQIETIRQDWPASS